MLSLRLRRRKAARRAAGGMLSWLIIFAIAAGFAIAFGILFGVFNKITTDLNATGISIDQSFVNSVNTASSFASTGILIVLAIGVIGLAMILIRVIAGMGGGGA
jgi:vacuolar-type H+-ATPase subunit I/STV1